MNVVILLEYAKCYDFVENLVNVSAKRKKVLCLNLSLAPSPPEGMARLNVQNIYQYTTHFLLIIL